jgi:DHA1 family multidrug/chloramphenicol efflux transport protein-like MFS transporter
MRSAMSLHLLPTAFKHLYHTFSAHLPHTYRATIMFTDRKDLRNFALFFLLYELTIYLSNDMIMPAMLQVVREFKASSHAVSLSLSLYILGGSLLQIVLGPLAERFGKRRVMLAGNALFLLATLLIPLANSIDQFLLARFFQGMGSCFIFIGYAMVHDLFDDADAVKLTTLLSNAGILAPLIGPVFGSAIVSHWPWQAVFGVSLLLGSTAFIGLYRFMPAHGQPGTHAAHVDAATILRAYQTIFSNRRFMAGILIAAIAITPLTAWIGLSPVIVMQHMKQPYATYILYQCVIFAGFILSTIAVQKLATNASLNRMIRQGAWLALLGLGGLAGLGVLAMPGAAGQNNLVFMVGMFVFSMGLGLFNGGLIRLAMTATGVSMNLTSSAMSLLYCVYIALVLELYNLIGQHFAYSLASFALCNVPLAIIVFGGLMWFTRSAPVPAAAAAPAAPAAPAAEADARGVTA